MRTTSHVVGVFCLVPFLVLVGCGGSSDSPAAPTLTSSSPATGFLTGGAQLTLSGTGFLASSAGTPTVTVGGASAGGVVVVSDAAVTCIAPPGAVGPADVVLTNANGVATLASGFTYYTYPPAFLSSDVQIETDGLGASIGDQPGICCSGSNVYVVWADSRHGSPDVYFNRSTDGGVTWLASDIRIETDTQGAHQSFNPGICCDGSRVYVIWEDERHGGLEVFSNRSNNGGASWLPADVRVDHGTGVATAPRVCCAGANVYVVWHDFRNGPADIYANRSTDGGATWLPADVQIDTDGVGAAQSWFPVLCCLGGTVHVAWEEGRNGSQDIYYSRSADGGATWLASDVRLDRDLGAKDAQQPRISCAGANVYVVWQEDRTGPFTDVYLNRSADGGATWLGADVRLDTDTSGAAQSEDLDICCEGSDVYVVWEDNRVAPPDIRLNRSNDAGATWLGTDVKIDSSGPGVATSDDPHVCCSGPSVYVFWRDDRGTAYDVYLNCSIDRGTTWLASDLRIDDVGPGTSWGPRLCCDGAAAYMVWVDSRNGPPDIYFNASQP